jgi:hypothetical protein
MRAMQFTRGRVPEGRLFLAVVVCVILPAYGSPKPPGADGQRVELGFVGCKPAIFVKPQVGMTIAVSGIAYDSFGYPSNFSEEVQYPSSKGIMVLVTVDNTTWHGDCSALRYRADVDGKLVESPSVREFGKRVMQGYVAFSVGEVGGLWSVPAGTAEMGELQTEFSCDAFGRRQIARQAFTREQTHYEIIYSDYGRDKFGRLSSYKAIFKK